MESEHLVTQRNTEKHREIKKNQHSISYTATNIEVNESMSSKVNYK